MAETATLLDEQQRVLRRLLNVPTVMGLACGTRIGTTPHDVVHQEHTLKLLRYRRSAPALHREPVLFCYALINRASILDLEPHRSLVRRYLEQGFDVYLIDWGAPSDADSGLGLEDYVCRFLHNAVRFILRAHDRPNLNLLGYCMGGTMSAMFSALYPGAVNTLTLLAAPIDFGVPESLLRLWSDRKHFDVDAFVDAHGNCPAWFLQSCFMLLKPVQNLLEKNIAFYEQMDDPKSIASHFAMERWLNDNIPMAGRTFREFVKGFYQNNELVRGAFSVGGERVNLARIACPTLLLTAKNDHLVPASSTEGIRACIGSGEVHSMTIDAGHVGLVVGGKAQRTIWPEATRWMAERSTPAP